MYNMFLIKYIAPINNKAIKQNEKNLVFTVVKKYIYHLAQKKYLHRVWNITTSFYTVTTEYTKSYLF